MAISENELMWARTPPEEVEANAPEVSAGLAAGGLTDGQEQPSRKDAEVEQAKPVVRVEETSRLEATLARLEMNSIEIKMHLDSLEQRISRMEPHLEGRAWGGAEKGPEAEPVRAREMEVSPAPAVAQPAPAVAEQTSAKEKSLGAEAAVSREAKEDRWSHLMGPDFDASGAAAPEPFAGVGATPHKGMRLPHDGARTPGNGTRPPVQAVVAEMSAVGVETPQAPSASGPEAGFSVRPSVRSAFQREAAEAWQPEGSGELGFSIRPDTQPSPAMQSRSAMQPPSATQPRPALQTDAWARRMPVASDDQRLTGARFAEREPVESFSGAGVAMPFPVQRDLPVTARATGGEEGGGQRLPPRRMFSVEERQVEEERPVGGPIGEPGMWRGYRVRRLVLAVVLLVLAAIPLAIWWRLSMDARDADAGDASPASRVEPGAVATPKEKARMGEVASVGVPSGPGRVAGAGAGHPGDPGLVADAGRAAAGGGAAPVIRRTPSVAAGASALPAGGVSGRSGEGRTSSGAAAVGGTAIGLAGQPGGADEVPGTSGLRVRVPEGVMAGHLLPTGDVGELPRGTGEVVAAMFISNTGRVEEVEVISGNKGLRDAAARAMRTWRYEPYVQAGVRVPVVTTASIRFDGGSAGAQ